VISRYSDCQRLHHIFVSYTSSKIQERLDTSSSNLWVSSSNCKEIACHPHHQHLSSASSSHQKNGSLFEIDYEYENDDIAGSISQYTLRVGDLAIMMQDFAEATKEMGRGNTCFMTDSVFALGYDAAAVNFALPPFHNQGLPKPVFALT
jgi:saccharopepsin